MVLKGQYLERPTVVSVAGVALEALYHRGDRQPPALLVPPGAGGGSPMELPLIAELAWALHQAGHPTLRFNARGLGASQGTPGDADAQREDAEAALEQLIKTVQVPAAAVVGIGEGWRAALQVARGPACVGLALIAPPPGAAAELAAAPTPVTRVFVAGDRPWPEGVSIERIDGADASFLRGLPALGKAVAAFVASL